MKSKGRKARKSAGQMGGEAIRELMQIPGVGRSIAGDLLAIGITGISRLRNADAEDLYRRSNALAGVTQDRCLLYVFRCAVYYATTPDPEPDKCKWWNWKDRQEDKKLSRRFA